MALRDAEMPRKVMLKLFIVTSLLFRGNCALECGDGQYQKDEGCRECKSTCARCISDSLCTECFAGFFGETCTNKCSEGCLNERCDKGTGDCISCKKGYYQKETCKQCPKNCTECLNAATCTNCRTGYTGNTCQKLCVNCKPDSGCSLEEGICSDGCKDRYSGYRCLEHCSSNCLSCDRLDAKRCTVCVEGKYGSNCKNCPTKCTDNSCGKETGVCTHGCQNGFWGNQCEYECPENCRDGKCLRSSGVCFDGCRGNFTGTKCLCPSTCDCDADGACTKCNDNTGYVCDKQCRSMCINNICSAEMERKCFYGCKDGYDGSLCTPLLTDLADDDKSYVTIIVILVVVAGILASAFCVTVFIKRRIARLSDGTQLATTQSCAEGCSRVASEMCNFRYPVSSDENELPSNVGEQNGDQYEIMQNSVNTFQESCVKLIQEDHLNAEHETEESQFQEENRHEYASLLETCREPSKAGALVQETGPRDNTLSGQRRPESLKARSQRAEGSTGLTEEPSYPNSENCFIRNETGSEEVSPEENFGGRITVDSRPGKGTMQQSKQSTQVSLRTKVPLKKLESLAENEIRSEFKELSACTEIQEEDERNDYELLKLSSVAKEYHDSLNACYIDGYKTTNAYIACATPGLEDKKLFWNMVWHEGCDRIVMLTDGDVDKQDKHYWPKRGDSFIREDFTVECLSHDNYQDFTQRMFEIKRKTEERIVLQLHFMAWPENLARMSADNLIEFQKYRETLTSEKAVPVIVHCSDGIGRTGTYIAFESLIQEGQATGSVDVFACVKRLRERRSITQKLRKHGKTVVQNYVQYYFLYKALQRWFKQDQQGYKRRQVVSGQTIDSSYEPVEPERGNSFSMFNLLHALDIPKD